jgi:hypothetical protein
MHPRHGLGITQNYEPTLTDQSQAANTDINIIVTQFLRTGQAPQGANPIYADFTDLPEDLRGFIEMGRSMGTLRERLPPQLQKLNAQELFALTTEQINQILTPPDKPPDKPKDEPK